MDRGGIDCRLAGWPGNEGWRLWRAGRHYSWDSWRRRRRLGVRDVGNLAGRRHDWVDHRSVRGCGDSGRNHAIAEESLKQGSVYCFAGLALRASAEILRPAKSAGLRMTIGLRVSARVAGFDPELILFVRIPVG